MAKIRAAAYLPISLALCSCGTRSVLDTLEGYPDGDGGVGGRATASGGNLSAGGRTSSGGSLSGAGGASAGAGGKVAAGGNESSTGGADGAGGNGPIGGGENGTGGSNDGGSPPAGGGPGYCYGDTYDADTGYGVDCEPWTDCQPGEYVGYPPSSSQDRQCYPCFPHTYSSEVNAYSCTYGGCEFNEREVTPGSPTIGARCEPDPNFDTVPSDETDNYGRWFMGLAKGATRAYAGFYTSGGAPKLEVYAYENGVRVGTRTLPVSPSESPSTFTTGLDGAAFLLTRGVYPTPPASVFAWGPDGSPRATWQVPPEVGVYNVAPFNWLTASDSHLIVWGQRQDDENGRSVMPLGQTDQNNLVSQLKYRELPDTVWSAVADDNEGFWALASAASGYGTVLQRFDSLDATPELALTLSNYSQPRIAVAPDGRAYLSVVEGSQIRTLEFGTDAEPLRNWSAPLPDNVNSTFYFSGTDVISDSSIIVGGYYTSGYPYPNSTSEDVVVARIDMASSASEFKHFVGPGSDRLDYLAATRSGAVYIAGHTYLPPSTYRESEYVRQVW